jgi:hypothetical protein
MNDEPKPKTTYVVLRLATTLDVVQWVEIGEYEASGPETAMRLAIADKDLSQGSTLVAPPKRSWRPLTHRRESKPVERLVPYSPPGGGAIEDEHPARELA